MAEDVKSESTGKNSKSTSDNIIGRLKCLIKTFSDDVLKFIKENYVKTLFDAIWMILLIIFGFDKIDSIPNQIIKKQVEETNTVNIAKQEPFISSLSSTKLEERINFYKNLAKTEFDTKNYRDSLDDYLEVIRLDANDREANEKISDLKKLLKKQ
ncbi:MAG: hypothetical protein H7844_04760 [Nitrospirae bacterium YQR-1]